MARSAADMQNRELRDTIKVLNGTIEDLRKLLKESNEQNEALRQQLEYLTKKLFGTSSEKRAHDSEGQISLFDEAEQEANPAEAEPEAEKTCGVCGTKMQPGGKKYFYDELIYQPAKVYILRHFVETVYCPQCKTSGEKNNIVSAKPERGSGDVSGLLSSW